MDNFKTASSMSQSKSRKCLPKQYSEIYFSESRSFPHLASIAVSSLPRCAIHQSMDEYSSDDEFNSSDNSIIDPNDIVIDGILTKGPWGPEEDKWLICFVMKNGEGKWSIVARELNRTPESCRLRWFNQLNPNINHEPFTIAEDNIIVRMIKKGGRNAKWSVIAKILERRTDNQVKNRWNYNLRKQYGHLRKKNLNGTPLPISASNSPCRVSAPRPADASFINSYFPPAFVVSNPFADRIYPEVSLCPDLAPAATFNRLTSLSLCPPGHETDDVLNPGIVINPSGLCPSPSQQYASVGNFYSSDARSDSN